MHLLAPAGTMREMGLSERMAVSVAAQRAMIIGGARTSVLGIVTFILYLQGDLATVDTVMSLMPWLGWMDGYVCWKEGKPGFGLFRAVAATLIGVWGMLGMSQR